MRKHSIVAVALVAVLAGVFASGTASAQDIQLTGPLAGAPAVRELKMYRQGRISLAPMGYFTINDEFMRHIMLGGRLEYNIFDFLALGLFGAYTLAPIPTRLADEVSDKGVYDHLNYPYRDGDHPSARRRVLFDHCGSFGNYGNCQLGIINYIGGVQASLIPFRGKFSLFGRAFIDADAFLFLGVGAAGLRERAETDRSENDTANPRNDVGTPVQTAARTAVAPTFGGGLNMYLSDLIALTIEYRMMPFSWNTSGTDEAGSERFGGEFPDDTIDEQDALLHFNQFFNIGVVFHLPTRPKLSE